MFILLRIPPCIFFPSRVLYLTLRPYSIDFLALPLHTFFFFFFCFLLCYLTSRFLSQEEEEDPLDDYTPAEAAMRRCLKWDLEKVLDTLTPREKQVIKCRFGMDCDRSMTLQAIGDIMDVSRERVRQIEESALKKLKEKNRGNEVLKLYLTDPDLDLDLM